MLKLTPRRSAGYLRGLNRSLRYASQVRYVLSGESSRTDFVSGRTATPSGGVAFATRRGFPTWTATTANLIASTGFTKQLTKKTYLWLQQRLSDGGSGFGRVLDRTASGATDLILATSTYPAMQYTAGWSGGNAEWTWPQAATTALNVCALSYDGSSTTNAPIVFVDGVRQTVTTRNAASGTLITSTDLYEIGNRSSDFARGWDGYLGLFVIIEDVLTDAELREITLNPWLLFAPAARPLWVPAEAGGGTTVSPGAGTLVLAGLAPAVTQQISAAPGAGALVLAGLAPAVTQTVTAAPGAGALTLTGLAPSVTQAVLVSPGAGALVLAGLAPTITAAEGPAPGAGVLLLNGLAPTVTQAVNISPDPGVLSLAGLAPSIAQGANVSPGAAALTLSGLTPSVTQDVVVRPDAGVLLFDGLAPIIPGQSATADPGTGALVLGGLAPTVTVSGQETVLDPKFAARRPNVVMRRLADLEPKEPLPADITNMPDAPEPPEPISGKLARGMDLGELPEDPTPEPAAEEQAEVAQRKSAAAAPAPAEGAGSTPALGATDAEPPQEAPPTEAAPEGAAEQVLARISAELALLAPKLTSAVAAQIDPVLEAVADLRTAVSAVQADLAAERKAQALRERNLKRAKEIADRLLNSD